VQALAPTWEEWHEPAAESSRATGNPPRSRHHRHVGHPAAVSRRRLDRLGCSRRTSRTSSAGLLPAVNMDTGYVQLLDSVTVAQVLDRTAS
jgi:hypothetical protein